MLALLSLALTDVCSPPPPRPRAILLAYTWGSGPSSCSPFFMRSWVALPPDSRARTDLVILWEGSDVPCAGEPAGAGAKYVKMPPEVLAKLKATRLNPAAYRMRAFNWWLQTPEALAADYGYVGVLDTDMIFQADLFDVLHATVRTKHELHLGARARAAAIMFGLLVVPSIHTHFSVLLRAQSARTRQSVTMATRHADCRPSPRATSRSAATWRMRACSHHGHSRGACKQEKLLSLRQRSKRASPAYVIGSLH